jgi:hypothetical protein
MTFEVVSVPADAIVASAARRMQAPPPRQPAQTVAVGAVNVHRQIADAELFDGGRLCRLQAVFPVTRLRPTAATSARECSVH